MFEHCSSLLSRQSAKPNHRRNSYPECFITPLPTQRLRSAPTRARPRSSTPAPARECGPAPGIAGPFRCRHDAVPCADLPHPEQGVPHQPDIQGWGEGAERGGMTSLCGPGRGERRILAVYCQYRLQLYHNCITASHASVFPGKAPALRTRENGMTAAGQGG